MRKVIYALIFFISITTAQAQENIVINEIMYDPAENDTNREWIEVYNKGTLSINISNYRFEEGGSGTKTQHDISLFKGSSTLRPGEYGIIADNAGTFTTEYLTNNINLFDSSFTLPDSGTRTLRMRTKLNGTITDEITYDTTWGGNGNGYTLSKKDPSQQPGTWSNSRVIKGTPGSPNYFIISPDSGTVGSLVTAEGAGFGPIYPVVIDFGTTLTTTIVTTNPEGTFSTTFTVSLQSSNTVTVTAKAPYCAAIDFFRYIPTPLLAFTKTVTFNGSPTCGATLTYTLYYKNEGLGTATNVVLTDAIPAGTTYITDSAGTNPGIFYSHDGGINYDSSQDEPVTHIKWILTGNIAPEAGGNVNFAVRVE